MSQAALSYISVSCPEELCVGAQVRKQGSLAANGQAPSRAVFARETIQIQQQRHQYEAVRHSRLSSDRTRLV